MLNLLFFWGGGGLKYGNNYINHKQLEPELNGTRNNITVKRKSLHDNKRRCYIGNKMFSLATAKFSNQISNFVSFSEAVLHVVFLKNLEHVLAIIHDRLGQPINTTWFREKGNDFSSINIYNKLGNIEAFGHSDAIPQSPSSARRQVEAPISLENPLIQEPFESLISPPLPAQFEDIRTDASVFNLYHPRSSLVQESKCWKFLVLCVSSLNKKVKFSSFCNVVFDNRGVGLLSLESHRVSVQP